MKSDEKVLKSIEATKNWLDNCKDKTCGIYYCEKRNLSEYEEMLGQNKSKLTGRLRKLYQAI